MTATRGLEAVSLRDVAAEAGVSMGMVQHYFSSKDRMLLFACEYLLERAGRRVEERLAATPGPLAPKEMLRQILHGILPLDEERRAGTRVWLAFLARAAIEPRLEEFMRATWVGSHRLIADQIRAGQQRGEITAERDVDREAVSALALADGLVSHLLMGHYTAEQALAAVDAALDRLFGT